jgi:hypothetical protein
MRYNRINTIAGWIVCAIACTVYLSTMEATASFWDCGEFIAACYGLQIPHPPGAPLFVLLGRVFIILSGNNPETAAVAVNSMSAIASGLTILFLFWTITHFARKLLLTKDVEPTGQQIFSIISAGTIGALAYTFSDSFWFSAVEGEVYALSSLFTALVFWAILKWEQQAAKAGSDRWLIFIFFVMGLSIGIHLLNLLVIPAIILVYYFKRYPTTLKGTFLALLTGVVITGIVQKLMIQSTVKAAGKMDVFFANDLGMPVFSGFAFFFLLLAGSIALIIRYANKHNYIQLKLLMWSMAFLLLGYSTYLTTMIRSNADPAVDMFNVDNPVSLAGYLGRAQYNDWPILYGPDFTDRVPRVESGILYSREGNKYLKAGKTYEQDWAHAESAHLFPRMWDDGTERGQLDCYQKFSGLQADETPTMAHNLKYFSNYQAGWMYFRYFMWNFAGRQNDLQGTGNVADSNWVSGISFIDNARLGDQSALPDSIHTGNKAYNRLFLLPLVLGFAGLIFQYRRNPKDFWVNGLLFFFTGFAIVMYLNQSGYQPRERDYAYVGSFYVFAVWIGLGVLAVKQLLEKFMKLPVAAIAAASLCLLAVPVLMASQEWDDHDRSNKTLARDLAKNYLESCPPNAVLFSGEDNDTYMLWYLQDVEGIRPDVRVVVNTIFSADWYINQLRYKINESDPVDVLYTKGQLRGSNRDVTYYMELPGFDNNKYYDLKNMLQNIVGSDDPAYSRQTEDGESLNILPVRKFTVPVDEKFVREHSIVNKEDEVVNELKIDMPNKNYLLKNELALLAVIASNNWKRPICFTSTRELDDLGLTKYARLEGMTYRLVPVENAGANNQVAYKNIMEQFQYGSKGKKPVYFDEENRRRMGYIQLAHAQVALSLAQQGKMEAARNVLNHFDSQVYPTGFPYGMASSRGSQHNAISMEFLRACYAAEDKQLAKKVQSAVQKDLQQQIQYYGSLGEEKLNTDQLGEQAYLLLQGKAAYLSDRQVSFANEIFSSYRFLQQLQEWDKVQSASSH